MRFQTKPQSSCGPDGQVPTSGTASSAPLEGTGVHCSSAGDARQPMAPSKPSQRDNSKGKRIKQLAEDALYRLPLNGLYIVLWVRSHPPPENDFHWALYHHVDLRGGKKYHVRNLGQGWIADHSRTGGLFKSAFLCILIQIGTVDPARVTELDGVMRSYDRQLNSTPNITCAVWLFLVVTALAERGFVSCGDVPALRSECLAYGNEHRWTAAENEQPRPVVVATKCS